MIFPEIWSDGLLTLHIAGNLRDVSLEGNGPRDRLFLSFRCRASYQSESQRKIECTFHLLEVSAYIRRKRST